MKIGLIADTHDKIPLPVHKIFAGVDLIIHAGDICKEDIITELKMIAPVKAVYGNMDRLPHSVHLNRIDFLKVNELTICITHIVSSPKAIAYELFKINKKADVVVFGHTHRAQETWFNKILFINPGSPSQPRDGKGPSVAILRIADNKPEVEFIFLNDVK